METIFSYNYPSPNKPYDHTISLLFDHTYDQFVLEYDGNSLHNPLILYLSNNDVDILNKTIKYLDQLSSNENLDNITINPKILFEFDNHSDAKLTLHIMDYITSNSYETKTSLSYRIEVPEAHYYLDTFYILTPDMIQSIINQFNLNFYSI